MIKEVQHHIEESLEMVVAKVNVFLMIVFIMSFGSHEREKYVGRFGLSEGKL